MAQRQFYYTTINLDTRKDKKAKFEHIFSLPFEATQAKLIQILQDSPDPEYKHSMTILWSKSDDTLYSGFPSHGKHKCNFVSTGSFDLFSKITFSIMYDDEPNMANLGCLKLSFRFSK